METQEVGKSTSLRGGRATEAQGPTLPHRQRPVDVDRVPCTTDQQEEQEPRQEPQDEARAAPRRRASFETPSVPSRWAERVLPHERTGRPRSVERVTRVTSQTLGIAALAPQSSPLPSEITRLGAPAPWSA